MYHKPFTHSLKRWATCQAAILKDLEKRVESVLIMKGQIIYRSRREDGRIKLNIDGLES